MKSQKKARKPAPYMVFNNYKSDFPVYLVGSLDQHETRSDYVYLVQHEIDLFEEGEESDIVNSQQYQFCKEYIKHYGPL